MSTEIFDRDNQWSIHKDLLLAPHWKKNSYDGRYVIPRSSDLQKTLGIDIILQDPGDISKEILIDTKHNPRFTGNFAIEVLSCSVKGREKKGWLLKEYGHPHFISYCFWLECESGCEIRRNSKNGCFDCNKDSLTGIVYDIPFLPLRKWYLKIIKDNREKEFKLWTSQQINRTTVRIVPIEIIKAEVGLKKEEYKVNPASFEIKGKLFPRVEPVDNRILDALEEVKGLIQQFPDILDYRLALFGNTFSKNTKIKTMRDTATLPMFPDVNKIISISDRKKATG